MSIEAAVAAFPVVFGGPLAGRATPVLLVIGAVAILLGIGRILRLVPRLSFSLSGRQYSPLFEGTVLVIVGAIIIVVGLLR